MLRDPPGALADPSDLEEARDIIARGGVGGSGMGVIVLAQLAEGADGVNRDLLAPGAPEWSWHVTGLVEFAEGTIEILDGTPSTVEADVNGWIANTNGHIGFWNYTVVQELPEASGPILLGVGSGILFLTRCLRRRRSRPRS